MNMCRPRRPSEEINVRFFQMKVHTASQYIYFNFSTCFGQLRVHHQENLLYLCDTL